ARFVSTPEAISNGLAFLQMDLTDPDFHRLALASDNVMDSEVRRLLTEAAKSGELTDVPVARLARALQATLHGSMLGWAIARQGTLRAWLKRDLETVLRPYRLHKRRQPKRSSARRRNRTA